MDDGTMMATDVVKRMIKHWWKLVALFLVFGVIASALFAYSQPKRFTAQSILLIGGDDLPTSLSSMVDQKRTGPLGADLPAVTQSAIIASTVIGDRVGKKLGMTSAAAESMTKSVSVKAQTDNLFAISVDGPTAELAAQRANTFATEYLAYRAESGKAVLNGLAATAKAQAKQESDRAASLNGEIAAAIKAKNPNEIAPLRTQQGQLLDKALTDNQDAAILSSAAQAYGGGGSLSTPAIAADATVSPVVWRDIAFGALLGLLVGVIIGSVLEKLSDRIRTRADAAEAAGHPVWMAVAGQRSIDTVSLRGQTQLAALAIVNSPTEAGLASGIVVRAVTAKTDAGPVASALREALEEQGRASRVVVLGNRVSQPDSGQQVSGVPGQIAADDGNAVSAGADTARALVAPNRPGARTRLHPTSGELMESSPAQPNSQTGHRSKFVVTLSGPHLATTSDLGDLRGGSPVLLVVTGARDRSAQVRRAARELDLAGMNVRGVVLLRADPKDVTEGFTAQPDHDGERVPARFLS